ncbi:MAG TPA: DUF4340 domain-containing protein [Tepidisphaeraceae bacterium]|jgi:hypothetical protein|nr:DUF4340 domain-containing protein [Tepidisphaeraceae bacterium]
MNFKTTIVLLVALLVVGGIFWAGQISEKKAPEQTTAGQAKKLLDLRSDQVKGLTITDADGNHTTLEKNGTGWRMTEPVNAVAVDWQTQDLVRTLCDLESQGKPEGTVSDSGLDKPKYSVAISTDDGKTVRLDIGNKNFAGDVMYARVDDGDVNLIDAGVAKTLKTAADDLRDKHLLTANSMEVQQVRIVTPSQRLVLNREGSKWQIAEPVKMPGDSEAISSLISTITGIEASSFVTNDSDELAFARFDHPTVQVWLSTESPNTRPTTDPSALPAGGQTLTIGTPDSLAKDHYFVRTSDGLVAKIASSVLDDLKKTPLDLRDKEVATILPEDVTQISLVKQMYSTPTTQSAQRPPEATQVVVLARRPKEAPKPLGPAAPSKLKAGARPSTEPATEPAKAPQSAWVFNVPADKTRQVDDSKVDTLLGKFNPLKADKYLETAPDSAAMEKYIVSLETKGATYHFEFVRPTNGGTPYGIYDDLAFEVATPVVDALDADFQKTGP